MSSQEFNNITTATIVFTTDYTKVLLIKRKSDEKFPSLIAFPGGRMQHDEDIYLTAKREVKEEVGLNIDSLVFLNIYFADNTMMVVFISIIEESFPRGGERQSFWVNIDDRLHQFDFAPNVEMALKDAIEYVKHLKQGETLTQIGKSITRTLDFLCSSTSTKEGYVGWDQFIGRGRVGVIGTAIGVKALCISGLQSHLIHEGVKSLEASNLSDGGWGVRSILDAGDEVSVVESTLYVLSALLNAGRNFGSQAVDNGVNWLFDLQHESGGWGTAKFRSAYTPRVFPTAFAITVLSKIEKEHKALKKAVDWLLNAQKSDGSWGAYSGEQERLDGTAVHTARAILALQEYDGQRYQNVIARGGQWLINVYEPRNEEGWSSTSEVTFVSERNRLDFKHYSTPWVVVALIKSGVPLSNPCIIRPITILLQNQNLNGYWTHHLAAGQIPIWATHDSLMAINTFKDFLWTNASDLFLYETLKHQQRDLLRKFISREVSHNQ